LIGAAICGLYLWQPLRYDLISPTPPRPHPWTDPDSERLFRPGTRVTVVTAHPDDSEFYIAGLLTRLARSGARLSLIVATDGDKGYYPFGDPGALRAIRRREQDEAARRWKASEVVYLGYPDGRLRHTRELVARIAGALRRLRPEYVLVLDAAYPPRLSHRDHRRAGAAAEEAARQTETTAWLLRFSTTAPNFAFDVTDLWEERMALLGVHASQFHGARLRRVTGIITRNAGRDGRLLGVRHAEGLRCMRLR